MRRLPHVNWLRTFEAAARHSSFAAAADELLLTPAAVSQQIKLLEETLEMKLFKRLPKGVELTDIGQAYAQPVRASFHDLKTATDDLFKPKTKTSLRVRASISFGVLVLAPRLHEFRALHPEIDIVLSTIVWSDRMSDATIDVDIRYGAGDWPEQDIWPLGEGQATLVCNPSDAALFHRDPTGLKDADIVPIIGSENDWPLMFQKLGLDCPVPHPWMPVDSSLLALESIATGRGVAIVNKMFSKGHIKRGLLTAPFEQTLKTQNGFYFVAQPDPKKQAQISLFYDWLTSIIA
ncbi:MULTISPECIES: LysR family transcriptional regulator [Pacificibacter]|uniref:LysR family transcriptional regulator n=1 Tax=Pacificibacter TaxID=1042323 RepID=UPI001C08E5C1|nr:MULTISPECIES: LysR family transcriptional regulator [Pacificibacter]MBU2936704.1 LysR family transcriptional regulator [Pacificibacter marinus]MDO6614494.1 LysR family transcriptional regulator [Pacificibacter sp. 1_MG-2023]